MLLPCKKVWAFSLLKMAASDPNRNANWTGPETPQDQNSTNKGRKLDEESTISIISP